MDFAAWMEVYLGDRWWTFDPRNNERRKGRVLIGRGRDAGDVAMATTFGAPFLESMTVIAEEVVEPVVARRPSPRAPAQVRLQAGHGPVEHLVEPDVADRGGAEEEAPVVAVGDDDDHDPVAGEGQPGLATETSDSISQASRPLTVVASLRRSARVGSYGSYIGPVIRHCIRLSAVFRAS